MARLNDPQMESLEALKKRYIRQNREIARVNSTQSVRIRNLECETTRLLSENIELREQVIKLQASLDRRERARIVLESVEATKKKLEEKVSELDEIVRGLGQAITASPQDKSTRRQPRTAALSPDQRTWKNQFSLGEMAGSHDGQLPAIHEDARSGRNSLNLEEYRSSLNFEEIDLPPPRPEEYLNHDSDEDLRPPASSLLETRPRRRRDSATALDLAVSAKPVTSKNQQSDASAESSLNKASKRKFEREAEAVMELVSDLEFKFSRMSERPMEVVRSTSETENTVTLDGVKDIPGEDALGDSTKDGEEKRSRTAKPIVDSDARGRKETVAPAEPAPPNVAAAPTSRRALGPKSTNSDPANSPLKQANTACTLANDDKIIDKLEKVDLHPPPTTKSYRSSNIRDKDTPPPGCGEPTNARASRRARSSVNYALPNLRDKMRRDDKAVEGARAEGKAQKRNSTGRLRSKEPVIEAETIIKREESEDVDGKHWLNLPAMLPPTHGLGAGEEPRKSKEIGVAGFLEKKPGRERREKELESGLPVGVVSQRRRRTSSLHSPVEGLNASEDPEKPGVVSVDGKLRNSESDGNHRSLVDTSTSRRKVYSHLPPSSMHIADEAEGNDLGARRATLGGAINGSDGVRVRGVRSNGNLTSVDWDGEDRKKLGSGVRPRSMML